MSLAPIPLAPLETASSPSDVGHDEAVDAAGGPVVCAETLGSIVRGLAVAATFWRPLGQHRHHERYSVRLLATPAYDVWLIGWWPGQRVGCHDHGRAVGALTVVEGALVDATVVRPQGDRVGGRTHVERRLLRPGALRQLPADLVHDVQNAGTVPATSIHAYSPPLTTMAFYGDDGEVLRQEAVGDVPPVLVGSTGTTIHPSLRD
ncbi:MAG TPA: cysteine dioxygenase family protein [Acidimicrobiales bacterium]